MIDHIILTVSNIRRSLAFYEAALAPINIKFFMPYKGANGHPDLWGFGDGKRAFFWLKHGEPHPQAVGSHSGRRGLDDAFDAGLPPTPNSEACSRSQVRPAKVSSASIRP